MHLLQTKLYRPKLMGEIVCRSRLNALMDRALAVPLTLVSAPAGYGKSVLVSGWVDSLKHGCAWVSLEESDSGLSQFMAYLAEALDELSPGAFPTTASVSGTGQLPAVSVLAVNLANELDRLDAPIVLVLDDYHRIEATSPVHILLSQVLEHPPANLHLVLIARYDPPLSLWALRAASMLNEVRSRDLSFRDEEAAEFLAATVSPTIGSQAIGRLQRETEGWAVGLRLVSRALRQAPEPGVVLDHLEGGIFQIQDYLLHEVLAQQPPLLRQCLLRSSILERFCPDLLSAVCQSGIPLASTDNSDGAIVDSLLRSDLFTIGLDLRGEWFRYHHLLRKLLRELLEREMTDQDIAELHLRASAWFETKGFITEAIEHALAGEDVSSAAEIVERNTLTEFASDHWYIVERWLAMLPTGSRQERPVLLLAEAWVRNLQHQLARVPPLIDEAQALLSATDSTDPAALIAKGMIGLLRGSIAYYEGQGDRSLQRLEEAVACLAETESSFFADAQMFLALARGMVGRHHQAVATLQASVEAADPSQAYLLSRLCGGLCFLHQLSGELHAARTQAQRLALIASANNMRLNKAWSEHLLGRTLLHTAALREASNHFKRAIEMRYLLEPKAAADAMVGLALARQLLGLDDEAATACEQLQDFAQELRETGCLVVARSCRARIDLLRGDTASARRWALSIDTGTAPHDLFFWLEIPQLTAARILIDEGTRVSLQRALELLSAVRARSVECRFHCQLIEVAVLETLALERQGKHDRAAVALDKAVSLARPGNWLRPFLETGTALTGQLERLRQQSDEDGFVDRILRAPGNRQLGTAIRSQEASARENPSVAINPITLDALTNRELDIVELLSQRLRSKEIAKRLYISTHTVNAHLKRIYRKLGVNNRSQAVERAADAGLLDRR